MKRLFYLGSGVGIGLIITVIVSAQTVLKPTTIMTKADYKYSATSTVANLLSETELIQVKEEYNNTQLIIAELQAIKNQLYRIERNTR